MIKKEEYHPQPAVEQDIYKEAFPEGPAMPKFEEGTDNAYATKAVDYPSYTSDSKQPDFPAFPE